MKLPFILSLCSFLFWNICVVAQERGVPHDTKFSGYPSREPNLDVLPGFKLPPRGYGNVPFFWWNGDTLNKERLRDQLDILKQSATDGFAVSYIHSDPKGADAEVNKKLGHGGDGRTVAGQPPVFSKDWWEIWNWFSGESAKRGLAVGLDDYTVGWTGNGYYPDEVREKLKYYKGQLEIKTDTIKSGNKFKATYTSAPVTLVAWPLNPSKSKKLFIDLTKQAKSGTVSFEAPAGTDWKVYTILSKENYMLHPDHGKELVKAYFQRFEDNMDIQGRKGMNYFFQDELFLPMDSITWSEDFVQQFTKRKGYDISPYLPALKDDVGPVTPKIRLDYSDVLMDLAEERYFKPVYDWVSERGLIYGCDNYGRGKIPTEYIDYFRAISWFTAPGNDAPARGSSFLQTKISSSIANLYKRPRTWLEAFHSMGWGSSGEWLTEQLDHHFLAGGNLICMHGLYYSTHGGWWEWAPPDFHYRMPYWPHMKNWLEYGERLSYVMSQGVHVSDIAVMYPTEPMQAIPGAKPDTAFEAAKSLSDAGLDYDFMDHRSLVRAEVSGRTLNISDLSFKILVLPDMKAMQYSSLEQIVKFYRNGGIIIGLGSLPSASSNAGRNDPKVDAIVKEIFGVTATDLESGKKPSEQTNSKGGRGLYTTVPNISRMISSVAKPDFIPGPGGGKVLHRRLGNRDLYMIMNVAAGNECFFRVHGKAEIWDAQTGETKELPAVRQTADGTYIRNTVGSNRSSLIVFSPGKPLIEKYNAGVTAEPEKIPVEGEWKVEFIPTMDNKWGDFRLPASNEKIGPEARTFRFTGANQAEKGWTEPAFVDSLWKEDIYGYGTQMETMIDSSYNDFETLISDALTGKKDKWKPYNYSWRFGVWDHPGPQGYHGLKGSISDGFIILDGAGHHLFRTNVYVTKDGVYRIETEEKKADRLFIDGQEVRENTITLRKGWHPILAGFKNVPSKGYKTGPNSRDERPRSAIVLMITTTPSPEKVSPYSKTLSMRWNQAEHLMFDPYMGKNKAYCYRFTSSPGLEEMEMSVYGKNPGIWIDGKSLPKKAIQLIESNKGLNTYRVSLSQKKEQVCVVAMKIESKTGFQGASVFPVPVKLMCRSGFLSAGDWSRTGQMRHYSGGLLYKKVITLSEEQLKGKIDLNLGDVVATCEVKINGKNAAVLMSKPYKATVSNLLKPGNNEIEVLVYSTLSNHYQTIPSAYRGVPTAGILGPVFIEITRE